MVLVKCQRCFGSAAGETFEKAVELIDHAIGNGRGVGCNGHVNDLKEIKTEPEIITPTIVPKLTPTKPPTGGDILPPISKTISSKTPTSKKTTKVSSK